MSFQVLVHRIAPTLKRITRRLNGHHSFFDDDDLYQEALGHLWTSYTKGLLSDKTDSYILQGCYFHLRNYLRSVREHAIVVSLYDPVDEEGTSLGDYLSNDDATLFDYIIDGIDMARFSFGYLTERERIVLDCLMEGMSIREVGNKLNVSHMMIWKIRNRIREKYLDYSGQKEAATG